jgi:RNA polymerase-interacting CarD/CdnL/TRCF family regulator
MKLSQLLFITAYEEVRHILDKNLEGQRSSSEIDLTAACDESVETAKSNNTESGNELIRGMYRKASENGSTALERSNSNIDDIMVIDTVMEGQKNNALLEKTHVRSLVSDVLGIFSDSHYMNFYLIRKIKNDNWKN